jgi:23S rRNA pseudouridine1911/1915/1917 synthase
MILRQRLVNFNGVKTLRFDYQLMNMVMAAVIVMFLVAYTVAFQMCVLAFVTTTTTSPGVVHHYKYSKIRVQLNSRKVLQESKDRMLKRLEEIEDDAIYDTSTVNNDVVPGEFSTSLVHDVNAQDNLKRLDTVVAAAVADAFTLASISRSLCSTLVTDGHVTVNGRKETRKAFKVLTGMRIGIRIDFSSNSIGGGARDSDQIVAQDIPLSILYEDEYMIVLNKAAGMVVHPAVGNRDGTIVNALAYYLKHNTQYGAGEFVAPDDTVDESTFFPSTLVLDDDDEVDDEVGSNDNPGLSSIDDALTSSLVSLRPGIVHRLDKGTTGVLVVAKTRAALAALAVQFGGSEPGTERHQRAEKTYLAITVGNPGQLVVIDKPIGRHPVYRQRMRVVPDPSQHSDRRSSKSPASSFVGNTLSQKGRRALSFVDTIAFDGKLAFVKVRIETGRTHQIRVHLQDRHTPIYGDDIYGLTDWNKRLNKTHGIHRPMLHAFRLKLHHPITGERMSFEAPLPDDMQRIVKAIYPNGEMNSPDILAPKVKL